VSPAQRLGSRASRRREYRPADGGTESAPLPDVLDRNTITANSIGVSSTGRARAAQNSIYGNTG